MRSPDRLLLRRILPLGALLIPCLLASSAHAQARKPAPAPPAPAAPAAPPPAPTPPPPDPAAEARAAETAEKLKALEQANEEMRRQLEALRQQQEAAAAAAAQTAEAAARAASSAQAAHDAHTTAQAQHPKRVEDAMTPHNAEEPTNAPATPEGTMNPMGVPITFSASLLLRYDYWHNSDLTDQLIKDYAANSMRARVRFGVEFGDKKNDLITATLRLSSGENPNPTIPVVPIGNAFRESSFGISHAFISVRPLNDRTRLSINFGRMVNPVWRGTPGTIRTEMIWDDDVNPAGISAKAVIIQLGKEALDFKLENVAGYFQVNETIDTRFQGLTGNTSLIMDQIKASIKYATAAVAFYDWENINAGLSSPAVFYPDGRSQQAPTDAFLLRPGLNNGNDRFAYGPQTALGYNKNAFRIINPTAQVHIPIESTKLGNPEVFFLFDYAYNFSARKNSRAGAGGTLGARLGDYTEASALNPLNVWGTYRYVSSDTTLAAFADSDLGNGTGYQGAELGASYRLNKHLQTAVSYFNYYGFPRMENHADRLFLDVLGEF